MNFVKNFLTGVITIAIVGGVIYFLNQVPEAVMFVLTFVVFGAVLLFVGWFVSTLGDIVRSIFGRGGNL